MKKAVILLSGGIDSATTLAIAQKDEFHCYAITFDYGQRHKIELKSAQKIANYLKVKRHITIAFDLGLIGGSALTDDIPVPKNQIPEEMGQEIPITYVPARNTIFLSFALGWAEVLGAHDIYIGANAIDYSGYPDCRPEYIKAYERMANLATRVGTTGEGQYNIHAPLINMSKADILRTGALLGVDFALTTSCYDTTKEGLACGICDACILRKNAFSETQIPDPTQYVL